MQWKISPEIKIYEALGCLADERLRKVDGEVRVYSSSGQKFYTVTFDEKKKAIMTNDNGSYWVGYLGYPAIAYLMSIDELPFNQKYAESLKGIAWKDINTKNKNDFEKTLLEVRWIIKNKGINLKEFDQFVEQVLREIKTKKFKLLGKKKQPPRGY